MSQALASYLLYWRPGTVADQFERADDGLPLLDHLASGQLERVAIGDIIYVVTSPPQTGELILVGRLQVGWLGNQAEAAQRLGKQAAELWSASWHALAQPNKAEWMDYCGISHVAAELRFISPAGHDRLRLDHHDHGVNPKQLQAMRRLEPATAHWLDDIWCAEPATDQIITDVIESERTALEGQRRLRQHYVRERDSGLAQAAKRHLRQQYGRLFCQVCGFDYGVEYGNRGEGFIELHHTIPLATYDTAAETHVEDFAMVCANCHRMIHRRKPWLTLDELRDMLTTSAL